MKKEFYYITKKRFMVIMEKKHFLLKTFLTDIYKHKTKYIIISKGVNKVCFEDEYKS